MTTDRASGDRPSANAEAAVELQASLISHGALPYLFIGSGISRRYLGLPDWEGLLRKFALEAGENFDYHLATANGDLPTAATSIAQTFHKRWWNDDTYAHQREQHSGVVRDDEGGLKVAIAEYVRTHDSLVAGVPGVEDATLAAEVALLGSAVVDGVITTNYDSLTDQLFPSFQPYVGQDELMMSDAQFIAETYKIHGAATQPLSLILTKGDYDRFSNRNHYLAAKLLTIFAEHPVIFVGYSLSDEYLNEILDNIATAVGPNRLGELGKRIYFVEWDADASSATVIEQTSIQRGGSRLPITRIGTHSFEWLWEVLTHLERPFPAAILRELRKHVFDLVTHPDPSQTREVVRAIPIDADDADEYRVVFGVGAFSEKDLQNLSTIGRTLRRDDVEQDVLGLRKRGLDPENLLATGIRDGIRATHSSYLPVHKYLLEAGRIASDGTINFGGLPDVVKRLAERSLTSSPGSRARFEREVKGVLTTPRQVVDSDYTTYFKLECLVLLDPAGYSAEDLHEVLVELYGSTEVSSPSNLALFRRVVCLYDRRRALEAAAVGDVETRGEESAA
ncbi:MULTISPECIES: SIR2 family protein [Microbacterium]|uniref:SIR2 family protein n=1 Tax=Microbacterium TaxID=33882 RepID=UPI00046AF760|nr:MULTISPECIES: SIR2 family protein [Microbacterium]MCZ0708385.1 SIR2 family protein [Microbacterium paraoxydans]MDH5132214.1 SIR2 family protein [Microbacterium sp. RD10]MDH5135487.1 SIR2 family protein [Microbacterium sp. RD11]MDH5143607.1 SIR2 family protein [Microbacterium sp. RD12]MDH5154265.1 SIR2 family protein [Microbacterium sp. RD06]